MSNVRIAAVCALVRCGEQTPKTCPVPTSISESNDRVVPLLVLAAASAAYDVMGLFV